MKCRSLGFHSPLAGQLWGLRSDWLPPGMLFCVQWSNDKEAQAAFPAALCCPSAASLKVSDWTSFFCYLCSSVSFYVCPTGCLTYLEKKNKERFALKFFVCWYITFPSQQQSSWFFFVKDKRDVWHLTEAKRSIVLLFCSSLQPSSQSTSCLLPTLSLPSFKVSQTTSVLSLKLQTRPKKIRHWGREQLSYVGPMTYQDLKDWNSKRWRTEDGQGVKKKLDFPPVCFNKCVLCTIFFSFVRHKLNYYSKGRQTDEITCLGKRVKAWVPSFCTCHAILCNFKCPQPQTLACFSKSKPQSLRAAWR